jgi:CBS-domain-containing membrane protein
MSLMEKFKGDGAALPPRAPAKSVALAWLGTCLAIGVLAALSASSGWLLLLGSFGASCVLVFGYPDVPFSQPRNVVLGHCLSTFVGLLFVAVLGAHWWVAGLSTATAVALMMLTRTVHPPAGSNPVIVFLAQPGWTFLLLPTLAGSVILILLALVYHNVSRDVRYPKYW